CTVSCGPSPASHAPKAQVVRVAEPRPSASAAAPSPEAPVKSTETFGGDRWGFVVAASANQRLAVLRRFVGSSKPQFAHHGETSARAEITLFDLHAHTERGIEDLIAVDPERRRFLVLTHAAFLVDSENGEWLSLDDGITEDDDNRCLPPRHAAFSPNGTRIGWITKQGHVITLDLANGARHRFSGQGRLWRVWPDDDGSVVLAEVDARENGWPSQRTSCACRWCNRFARSYGMYGWSGPGFHLARIHHGGQRTAVDSPPEAPQASRPTPRCTVEPKDEQNGLQRGPWRFECKDP
ncbi:MAG TPA: hypothetical protein PKA88_38070, partial [Polyangiaceae bacterium]|nr:hypothetical protein [Polyangiaceae bacterium]